MRIIKLFVLPLVFCLSVLCLSACDGTQTAATNTVAGADAASGVSTLLATVAGMLQTSFKTTQNDINPGKNFFFAALSQLLGFAQASVTTCTVSPYSDSCSTGTKLGSYSDCEITGTSLTFSGTITLVYSDTGCAFSAAGQTVKRLTAITRDATIVEKFTTSSGSRVDYRGTTIGGGTTLTKTAGGYELTVLGFNKFYTNPAGVDSKDVSITSTTNVTVSDPTASSITFTGGALTVVDSVHDFVATYVPSNVVVNYSTCCYPSSGTMSVTYTAGSLTGTSTVTFGSTQCGDIRISDGTSSGGVSLWGCQ